MCAIDEVTVTEMEDVLQRGYRYAFALTGDEPRAEDLLQDAWTSVLQAGGPRDKAYLFRSIRNRWIDHHRRSQVVAFEPMPDEEPPGPPEGDWADRDTMARALEILRPDEREALFLCVVEGHTAEEVAQRTGRPRNTVLSLLHRGRGRLKEWFEADAKEVVG